MCNCVYLLHILFILTLSRACARAQELKSPDLDFTGRSIVHPVVHHGRTKREMLSTRDISGAHHSEVQVTVPVNGEQYLLDLRLNKDLVAGDHTLQYQEGGKTTQHRPKKEELDLCHYSGNVRGKPESWVAVSTCHGVRGVIFDGQTMRYIEPAQGPEIQSSHYLYDHKDLNTTYFLGHREGLDEVTSDATYDPDLSSSYHKQNNIKSRFIRYKRTSDKQVQGPYNANKDSRYVELVLVVDHREFQASGGNLQTVHSQMIQVANIINSLYSPLNIYIALVGVVVWNERDEILLDENADITLSNFLIYRKQKLASAIPNDNAHLLTRQRFSNGVVANALKGPMCTFEFSGGVAINHSSVISVVATTIAHGMGHNFGMEHDTEDCKCPDDKCIMSFSISSVVPVHWSSCSLSSLKQSFDRHMDYCLNNKPKSLYNSPICGNGFIEPGEQCDCGITDSGGANPCHACCQPDTCILRGNATCGTGACCDLTSCRLKPAAVVCRAVDGECDLPEFCTGSSEFCSADVYRMDSTPCGDGDNQAYCVGGACRSHTDQCRLLWGSTGESADHKCYTYNTRGTRNGNCGYDRINQTFTPCASVDVLCGMLQCRHQNERLEFGMESVALISAVFVNSNGSITPCRSAVIDLGLNDVDPGLVPDGAKCGQDRMCLKQRCVPIEIVQKVVKKSSVCPSDCSGHGMCNSEGHCHCEQGFAPPLCADPGPGGSVDSGPASDYV